VSTFVLVHGAWHGAWAFERLLPHLPRTIPVHLPCDDTSAGLEDYARAAADAAPADEEIIVVGSSLGGLTIGLVAALRPVRRLVYLNAFVPEPGRSMADLLEPGVPGIPRGALERDGDGSSRWVDFGAYHRSVCGDAAEEDARWAYGQLRRQARRPQVQRSPLVSHPSVPTTYVVSREDLILPPDYCRRQAQRLGVEPIDIPGDHFPALTRPRELAGVLLSFA
jgi:pimeloyl-ACP methyl ester carboxylesterase